MGNEKGDVRGALGILSVIKCRKGAHDAEDEAHDLNTMMAGRQCSGHCGNIVTFRGINFNANIATWGDRGHLVWSGFAE